MSDTWKTYPHAPAKGKDVCHFSDLDDPGTLAVDVDGFPLLLVRSGNQLHAFVNACPHQYLPLDHKGNKLLSADATKLRCTNHSAGFDIATGEGVEGLGIGCALSHVPVRITENHRVVIA